MNFVSIFKFIFSLDCHIVEVDVDGPGAPENQFTVKTVRRNPAATGVVTGNATYASFWSSALGNLIFNYN